MKRALSLVVAIIFLLMAPKASLAELTWIAGVDFDSDTLGSHPFDSLADGFYPNNSAGVANYSVQESLGDLTGQSLLATRSTGPGSFNFGVKIPTESATATEFVLSWKFVPLSGFTNVAVILRGPNLGLHGTVRYSETSILLNSGGGAQNDIEVGILVPDQANIYEWAVNRTTGEQSLWIDGTLVIDNLVTAYKFPSKDVSALAFEGAGQGAQSVGIDSLELYTGQRSGVPVEKSSWGKVKAIYR